MPKREPTMLRGRSVRRVEDAWSGFAVDELVGFGTFGEDNSWCFLVEVLARRSVRLEEGL